MSHMQTHSQIAKWEPKGLSIRNSVPLCVNESLWQAYLGQATAIFCTELNQFHTSVTVAVF